MSKNSKGALILTHLRGEGAANLGSILVERGVRTHSINVPSFNMDEIDPLRPDLLVVMGGPIGVYQQDDYPFVKNEIEIIKARLDKDLPTIGICLGSQMIAAAAGSKIYEGTQGKELGWYELCVTDVGKNTEVRHLDAAHTNMFHWHGDTFDLPENATLLASSKAYKNQIFQIGQNTLGLQCHPEVTHSQLNEWLVIFVGQVTGEEAIISIDDVRKDTLQHIQTMEKQSALFFNEWLEKRGF